MMNNCFVYGTLIAPEVLQTLLGRVPITCKPGYLPNFSRFPVKGYVYPGVIPSVSDPSIKPDRSSTKTDLDSCVEGVLLTGLSEKEMKILDLFEDEDYTRSIVPIILKDKNTSEVKKINTNVYVWTAGESMLDLHLGWNYDDFRQNNLEWYLRTTVRPCKIEIDRLGVGS